MILITGGTGFLGSHLVPRLTKNGEKIRCLVRDFKRAELLKQYPSVELVLGDVTNPESLKEPMKDVETVIHLVSIIREKRNITFDKVNVQGTKNMIKATESVGVKLFIYISVLGADSQPKYRYTFSKFQAEQIVKDSKLDWIIFRPAVIFGKGFGFGFVDRLVQSFKIFPLFIPIPGKGKNLFQPIWVEDVVSYIIQSIEKKEVKKIYEIGGLDRLSYKEIVGILMESSGIKKAKFPIPIFLMKLPVKLMERIMKDPPVTSEELKYLKVNNIVSTANFISVKSQFGFDPLPFNQGLDYLKPQRSD